MRSPSPIKPSKRALQPWPSAEALGILAAPQTTREGVGIAKRSIGVPAASITIKNNSLDLIVLKKTHPFSSVLSVVISPVKNVECFPQLRM